MQSYSRLYGFDIYPILETSVSVLTARDLLASISGQNLNTKTLPLGSFSDKSSIVELVGRRNAVNSPKMLPQRIVRSSALRSSLAAARRAPVVQRRSYLPTHYADKKTLDEKYPDPPTMTAAEDPGMNGGYINPPRVKRQHRDPYAQWWDPQERRNFGEPVHEDNDVLGIFSPWDYTWTTTGPGLIMIGTFVATFLGVCGIVYLNYPDRPSYPREFEGGLEKELGGPGAVRARMEGDEEP